ncbi:hypothetical protein V6N12_032704 [Hibiscus sabdariffa]|uniref:Putative plant transposon protein domain-containing protein n=1 Tax=Hibiscus sabdariffa TaxID=183260 RepID=A0ABR2BNJ8_9ROSI
MPNYVKFLKDMVTRKKRIEEFETAAATETCLALMHNKVPAKKTDPRSFTIKCFIGHNYPTKALCDLGPSINLMPKSVFQKLGIGEARPTTVMLQLADHSYVQPEGKIEDILVQVDKFIFLANFLILDYEADEHAPIILGRSFLSTSRAIIDFDEDKIIFKVDDDKVKMKSLTKQLDKGKGIAITPAKDTPKPKLYMGAHVERDRTMIQVNYGLEPIIYNRLNDLDWFQLARQPAQANLNWVIEFYTSNLAGEDNTTVPGRRVAANATITNSILGLPDNDPSFYAMLSALEEEDFEQIKDFLCEEGTAWNTMGKTLHSVSRPSLRPEAKLWNTFVKRNLMPTSHNQTVDRTRLLLIHTIMTGYRVNVGEILAKELAAACANDKGILAFPCLISALCRRAAVPTSPGDKYQAEKTGWTRVVYMRKMDVVDATPLNVAIPTPPTSPIHMPAADANEAGPSVPAEAPPAPADARQSPAASPLIVPVSSHTTTTSPATTPAAMPASRESTPDSPLGSTLDAPPSPPPPAQSEEAAPLHVLQLRN